MLSFLQGLVTMKVPDYTLTEAYAWDIGPQDKRSLPAGSFVKPVDTRYVPAEVREKWRKSDIHRMYDDLTFAYTHFGFILVPRKLLRAG
jgi:hypothetical protein